MWKIKTKAIHPELRTVGTVIRLSVPHFTRSFFKLSGFLLDKFGLPNLTKDINYEEKYITRANGSSLRICVYSPKEKKENVKYTSLPWKRLKTVSILFIANAPQVRISEP